MGARPNCDTEAGAHLEKATPQKRHEGREEMERAKGRREAPDHINT